MAWRIEEFVVRGEIRNGNRNTVSGWLEVLRTEKVGDQESAEPTLVMLSLTGNLTGDLEGRTFRFAVREHDLPQPQPALDHKFQLQQVGAMGDNLFRTVRVPTIPIEEYLEICDRGETPPEELRASIYLEWFSQNGRIVLELLDPKIEWEGEYRDLADPESDAPPSGDDAGPPEITTIIRHDDGTFEVVDEPNDTSDPPDDADPFALFPRNLEDQIRESAGANSLDTEAGLHTGEDVPWMDPDVAEDAAPPKLRNWEEVLPGIDPATKAMYEEWDEVIYGTKDEPLTWLFEEPLCLPKPDDVGDEKHAWQVLSALLTAMALRGVAFDMCPHFTALQAYRLLIDELLPRAGAHPNLAATGFVKHYCSWEYCAECDAEFEARS